MNLRYVVSLAVVGFLCSLVEARPQEAAREVDLTWKLPHDRAAIYDVYDSTKGTKQGEFWLLGCELERRIGATHTSDIPFRFLFRTPRQKMRIGASEEIREFAFNEAGSFDGVAPLQVVGRYRLRQVRKMTLAEEFRTPFRGAKEKQDLMEVALIEGHLDLFRSQWLNGQLTLCEQRASASLYTLVAIRTSDGAIVAGRYQWDGRTDNYDGKINTSKIGRGREGAEVILKGSLVEVTKVGLKSLVDQAVQKGEKWLKRQQDATGRISDPAYPVGTSEGLGATALALMALLHSGLTVKDPEIQNGFSYLKTRNSTEPYDLALHILAIDAKYMPVGFLEDIENYSEEKAREVIARRISKEDKGFVASIVKTLLTTQADNGAFGYSGAAEPNLSHTQFTALALKAALRMGVDVPSSIWRKLFRYLGRSSVGSGKIALDVHRTFGGPIQRDVVTQGWGYGEGQPRGTGTMTCAALAALAICESELVRAKEWSDKDAKLLDDLTWGGFGWIQGVYSMRSAPPEGCTHRAAMLYYFLYGLERAMILWNIRSIAGHDWYFEGSALLVSWQHADGRWTGTHGSSVIDTAWALLFLKRATIPVQTSTRVSSVDKLEGRDNEKKGNQ